ncbi:MAG: hypothetical protein ACFFD1_00920 [Candidatus Thorarchaeota archaeon]
MTTYNRPLEQTIYSQPNQLGAPDWMKPKENSNGKIIKNVIKISLSVIYGFSQAILFSAWLIIGIILASNYYSPFSMVKDIIIIIWRILFVIIGIYCSWYNYRRIK